MLSSKTSCCGNHCYEYKNENLVQIQIGKNASISKKLTTQRIHFSKNFQIVASDPCKYH